MHILNKFSFKQGIRIYGQPGTKSILNTIVNKPYTISIDKLPFKIEVNELSEGLHKIPFSVTSKLLLHSSGCFGYRLEIEGKIVSYCPDTGVCENAVELARGADLLITECSYASGQESQEWPHLNPQEAAKIARNAGAKKLVLAHFDASIYRNFKEREAAKEEAKRIFADVNAAIDGMEIEV